jgi:hypothetical protein
VAPDASCHIGIDFKPSSPASVQASVTVSDSGTFATATMSGSGARALTFTTSGGELGLTYMGAPVVFRDGPFQVSVPISTVPGAQFGPPAPCFESLLKVTITISPPAGKAHKARTYKGTHALGLTHGLNNPLAMTFSTPENHKLLNPALAGVPATTTVVDKVRGGGTVTWTLIGATTVGGETAYSTILVSASGVQSMLGPNGGAVFGMLHTQVDGANAWTCKIKHGRSKGGDNNGYVPPKIPRKLPPPPPPPAPQLQVRCYRNGVEVPCNPPNGGRGGAPGGSGAGGGTLGPVNGPYIDPSGLIVNVKGHWPLEGATVVLERAAGPGQPFQVVANGDASIMQPAINPQRTDPEGHYGWLVVPGLYRVTASHPGCKTATSRTVKIPPAVTDLTVSLRCPHLRRTRSHLSLRLPGRITAGSGGTIQVRVRSHGTPDGPVTVALGGARFTAPLEHGRALIGVPGLRAGTYTATVHYEGDGLHLPANARLKVHVLAPTRSRPRGRAGA